MAYKSKTVETTVSGAISDAFSEFASLAEEMRETYDNMEGANMGHMDKCVRCGEAADELEGHDGEPDVPQFLQDVKVTTTELVNKSKKRGPSRAIRLSNAQSLLQAVRDTLQEFVDNFDANFDAMDPTQQQDAEGQKDEAESLINDLDEHCDFDVEFPGMFG